MRRILYNFAALFVTGSIVLAIATAVQGPVAPALAAGAIVFLAGFALSIPYALTASQLPAVVMRRRARYSVYGWAIPVAVWIGDKILAACWMGIFRLRNRNVTAGLS